MRFMKIGYHKNPISVGTVAAPYTAIADLHINVAVGCTHGCRFCFIPKTYEKSQAAAFEYAGIKDGEDEHGEYLILRPKDEMALLKALTRQTCKMRR